MWPKLPPRSGGCLWARETAVSLWRIMGREIVFDCARIPAVLNGRAKLRFRSPPRSGGFFSARSEGATTSAAKRRLCVGARSGRFARVRNWFDSAWDPGVLYGHATLRFRSPPRSGCFFFARSEGAAISAAYRRLRLRARSSGLAWAHAAARNCCL